MKNDIKTYIINEHILYPKYNRNIARQVYWKNIDNDWCTYIFNTFKTHQAEYPITFADFLRYHFFDENIEYYPEVESFLKHTKYLQINPNSKKYKLFYKDAIKFINFTPTNFTEIIYCYRHNLYVRPKCIHCKNNDVKFIVYNSGYRKFCSQKCQINYNNSLKDIAYSNASISEIIDIITSVPCDLRNLTSIKIASVWLNVLEYTKDLDIKNNARLYLYVNQDLTLINCSICGSEKKFISQNQGYKSSCGRIMCINATSNNEYYNELGHNSFVNKGGESYNSGFIYVLYSKENEFYKIGITQNPIHRLNGLRKTIVDFEIITCIFVHAELGPTEKHFHKKFKSVQIKFDVSFDGFTEIFNLTETDIDYIKDYLHEAQ